MAVTLLNYVSVGIFGIVLSASFCDIFWTRQKRLVMLGSIIGILGIQGMVMISMGAEAVRWFYPIITHLPLFFVLWKMSRKWLWSGSAIFTTYLCCQLRRWLALLAVEICSGNELMQDAAELVLTFPLLYLLIRFVAPSVQIISRYTIAKQCEFCVIPLLAYGFDYVTNVYNDWFKKGTPIVVEFMFFLCSVVYIISVLRSSKEEQMRNDLEQAQKCLNLQVAQSVKEIQFLRESQQKTDIYRHDMRHHLQYVLACIENDRIEQAKHYIQGICSEIEANKVITFCENEAANLILSNFMRRAKELDISMEVSAGISRNTLVAESDLCVLLSNALENALHACQKLREKELPAKIQISAYEKNRKLFIQIINSFDGIINFKDEIPVASNPGHGIGVKSICTLVEKYGGIYSFKVEDKEFIFRVSL